MSIGECLPNRFPDASEQPEYNSIDAALWFFEAAHAYLTYTQDEALVTRELYPKLKEIVDWHLAGTRISIQWKRMACCTQARREHN